MRPRPLVLLCDVSGSMERYSRMVALAHALTSRHVESRRSVFSTRLTRITKQMRARRPDAALAAVSRSVPSGPEARASEAPSMISPQWAVEC